MSITEDGTVRHEVVVDAPQERVFAAFSRLDAVKPREHNLLDVPIEETVLEPWPGGDVYDRGSDGSTCRWARVLAHEPPRRLVLAWLIGPDWRVADDPSRASEIEVTFTPLDDGRTTVLLVHRHLERHGAGSEELARRLDAGGGWPLWLDRLATASGSAA
ncbi:SRPBCC family protein [Nocardioides sp. CFH 31398]|uniref:SRPBCC family protein n=1 Tax=Nocardioides sp. CFH 31398 TaxID=2919579 RepID=UPI001F065F1E|nr:SRPBCC family protein [Nocardioides sp. CFH 31398]MCH1866908.1 SRPBCC family protein [Nocardioides sp. CFH 31398]